VITGDFNGDGKLDVAVLNQAGWGRERQWLQKRKHVGIITSPDVLEYDHLTD
jgi:FG-GAP repeat